MTGWAPVVYGRTLVADRWWRALPAELDPDHWAAKVVLATVAGGAGLTRPRAGAAGERVYAPRTAFARGADGTLVGVACRARQLREDLCKDDHERELYCFVGWFTADPGARGIPPQAAFAPGPESWASKAYYEYTEPVWRTRPAKLSILPSKRGPAPWEAAPWEADPGSGAVASTPPDSPSKALSPPEALAGTSPRHVTVFPADQADRLWQLASKSAGPFILVTGWQKLRQAPLDRITALTVDDVTKGDSVQRPAMPVPPVPAVTAEQKPDIDQDAVAAMRVGAQQRRPGEQAAWRQPKSWLRDRWTHSGFRRGDDHDDVWSEAADHDRPASETRAEPVEPELPARRGNKKLFEGLDDC